MKIWKTQMGANNEPIGEVEINREIFQGDSLSPLLFIIAMLPLTCILREASAGYQLSKEEKKINHLLFMEDVNKYMVKMRKRLTRLCRPFENLAMMLGWTLVIINVLC